MTQCSESQEEAARPTPLLTPRKSTRIATWNVRTMYQAGITSQVAQRIRSYNISLLGLCETRRLQTGQLRLASGELLWYSGHTEEGEPHSEGVALMLAQEAQQALVSWEPVSSRIITVKFAARESKIHLNVIQCYAPANDAGEEKKK
ncbi:hypothetical protein Bbelb_070260 [Branchiostoma belcheri]|nr:hypothetical protein Bbelb_070260 [Branchiostoma belcheri]